MSNFLFQSIIVFSFDFDLIAVIVMSFCVKMSHFRNIASLTAEIWRLIDFQDDSCGCSVLILVSYLLMSLTSEGKWLSNWYQISSTYLNWQLRYNYFRSEKNTSAIFELYFQFRFQLWHRNWHAILYHAAELHPNQTIHSGNMMLYPFLKMAAASFVFVDVAAFRRAKFISKPNFVDISQLTAEI